MTPAGQSLEQRLAESLLRLVAPREDVWWIVGDLREAMAARRERHGEREARGWYRREVVHSLLPLLRRRIDRRREPDSGGDPMWQNLLADLSYASRLTRRSPLSSFAIVLTMVLGIGATTAVFSVVNAVLLRPLPFADSDRVVELSMAIRGNHGSPLAYPDLLDYQRAVPAFSEVSGVATSTMTLQGLKGPEQLRMIRTDDAYARIFDVRPLLGRFFTPDEILPTGSRAVILTNSFWLRDFGGDTRIVGRTVSLDNEPYTVVGVLPPMDFLYPRESDALVPLRVAPGTMYVNRGAMWIDAVAKIRPGVTLQTAAAQLASVTRNLAVDYPKSNTGFSAELTPLRDVVSGSVRPMLLLLVLSMAAVLLIASLNIANLLLGKAQSRGREFAVRSALGGSASRIRRQIFSEGMLLAGIGGVLGLLVAPLLTRALLALYPSGLPRAQEVGVDLRVLTIAVGTTLFAGILSVFPLARRAGRVQLAGALREGERGGASRSVRRAGRTLVIVQVATSVTLLFASTLLVTTFVRLARVTPGSTPPARSPSDCPRRARVIPGMPTSSGTMTTSPPAFRQSPEYRPSRPPPRSRWATCSSATSSCARIAATRARAIPGVRHRRTPGFDQALGMKLLRGRSFDSRDDSTAEHVVVIDEALAKSAWPGEDALGKIIDRNYSTGASSASCGRLAIRASGTCPHRICMRQPRSGPAGRDMSPCAPD